MRIVIEAAHGEGIDHPLGPSTVHRLFSREGLFDRKPPDGADRRRFAFREAGEMWMSDVMHGPKVRHGRTRCKTYLIAFIDDATRAVPFAAFAMSENTSAFLPVFRNALIRRGLPQRLYVDNGAAYRSRHLALVCARLGVALIHARPWQPAGKGKIERFFRTLRAGWLGRVEAAERETLETLIVEAIAAEATAPSAVPAPEEQAPPHPAEAVVPDQERDAAANWRVLYRELQRDWNDLVARAEEPDLPLPLMNGYDALIPRVRALAAHPDLTERAHDVLEGLLEYHEGETVARQTAEDYLASAERHVELYKALERQAEDRGVPITDLADYPKWREAAEILAGIGRPLYPTKRGTAPIWTQ